MEIFSVTCDEYILNGNTSTLGDNGLVETDNKEIYAAFKIKCDGKEDNVSFNLDYYGDDEMVVEQNRSNIEIYIKENKTPYDKYFTLICTHANDKTIYLQIDIQQKAEVFKLEITSGASTLSENVYTDELNSIIQNKFVGKHDDENYNYYEEREYKVNVVGGSKKYRVETILKCHPDTEDNTLISYSPFDKGFILNKFNDKFVIRNYGRPFLNDSDYYLIRFCHEDYREVTIELKLTYSQVLSTRRMTTTSTKKRGRKKVIKPQISDAYLTYEKLMQKLNTPIEKEKEKEKVIEIKFAEDIGEIYNIVGKQVGVTLPFEIYEDGEISDLLARVHATSDWCTAKTDNTNRNLILNIHNQPVLDRMCYVKVSVVGYPETFVKFILKNTL